MRLIKRKVILFNLKHQHNPCTTLHHCPSHLNKAEIVQISIILCGEEWCSNFPPSHLNSWSYIVKTPRISLNTVEALVMDTLVSRWDSSTYGYLHKTLCSSTPIQTLYLYISVDGQTPFPISGVSTHYSIHQGCQLSWIIRETPDFWTVSSSLRIRVWNLLDNCRSLPFLVDLTLWQWNFKIVSSQTPVWHCNISINVIGGK